MMMPLLGQLTRSWWRVVSVVIVSPQLGCWSAAAVPPPRTTTPTTASTRTSARETNVTRAACRRSLAGILSSLCLAAQGVARVGANLHPAPTEHKASTGFSRSRSGCRSPGRPPGRHRPETPLALQRVFAAVLADRHELLAALPADDLPLGHVDDHRCLRLRRPLVDRSPLHRFITSSMRPQSSTSSRSPP